MAAKNSVPSASFQSNYASYSNNYRTSSSSSQSAKTSNTSSGSKSNTGSNTSSSSKTSTTSKTYAPNNIEEAKKQTSSQTKTAETSKPKTYAPNSLEEAKKQTSSSAKTAETSKTKTVAPNSLEEAKKLTTSSASKKDDDKPSSTKSSYKDTTTKKTETEKSTKTYAPTSLEEAKKLITTSAKSTTDKATSNDKTSGTKDSNATQQSNKTVVTSSKQTVAPNNIEAARTTTYSTTTQTKQNNDITITNNTIAHDNFDARSVTGNYREPQPTSNQPATSVVNQPTPTVAPNNIEEAKSTTNQPTAPTKKPDDLTITNNIIARDNFDARSVTGNYKDPQPTVNQPATSVANQSTLKIAPNNIEEAKSNPSRPVVPTKKPDDITITNNTIARDNFDARSVTGYYKEPQPTVNQPATSVANQSTPTVAPNNIEEAKSITNPTKSPIKKANITTINNTVARSNFDPRAVTGYYREPQTTRNNYGIMSSLFTKGYPNYIKLNIFGPMGYRNEGKNYRDDSFLDLSGNISPYCVYGSTGRYVAESEGCLIRLGYLNQAEYDGVLSYKDMNAIKRFQQEYGLNPTGIIEQRTYEFLKAALDIENARVKVKTNKMTEENFESYKKSRLDHAKQIPYKFKEDNDWVKSLNEDMNSRLIVGAEIEKLLISLFPGDTAVDAAQLGIDLLSEDSIKDKSKKVLFDIGTLLVDVGFEHLDELASNPKVIDEVLDNAKGAGKSVELGTSFGKMGTLVENPSISVNWDAFAEHGLERMTQRGVTKGMVESWVTNGKALQQGADKYLFITKEGAAVVTKEGKLVTTYSSANFDENMTNIVNQLYGK